MTLDTPVSRHAIAQDTADIPAISGGLLGRRAIVTAVDTNLGRAVADAFRSAGAAVASVSSHPTPGAVAGDLAEVDFAAHVVSHAGATLGGIDVVALVPAFPSVAGRSVEGPVDRVLNRTARPLFHLAEALRPYWREGMSIIATAVLDPQAQSIGDLEARASLETFTKSLADRMNPAGVRVNAIAAGSRGATDADFVRSFLRLAMRAPASVTGRLDIVG